MANQSDQNNRFQMHQDPVSWAGVVALLVFGIVGIFMFPGAAWTCGIGAGFCLGVMSEERWGGR